MLTRTSFFYLQSFRYALCILLVLASECDTTMATLLLTPILHPTEYALPLVLRRLETLHDACFRRSHHLPSSHCQHDRYHWLKRGRQWTVHALCSPFPLMLTLRRSQPRSQRVNRETAAHQPGEVQLQSLSSLARRRPNYHTLHPLDIEAIRGLRWLRDSRCQGHGPVRLHGRLFLRGLPMPLWFSWPKWLEVRLLIHLPAGLCGLTFCAPIVFDLPYECQEYEEC